MRIEVEGLSFSYKERKVLDDVSFSAGPGRFLAVLGPNGVGKTTLFRCILGLEKAAAGRILIGADDIRALGRAELARRIAYIPQARGTAFGFTVMDMVLMGTNPYISPFSVPRSAEAAQALEALEALGIAALAPRSFVRLSGGEQQMVLVARALAQKARILLMDEPTSSLDYGNQAMVLGRARALARGGYTVVMTTHNPQQALDCADDCLALKDGKVLAFGRAASVLTPALIESLYGIRTELVRTRNGAVIAQEAIV